MDGGKKTLTELQFSTNLIGSNTSLHRKTRTKSNQNIVPLTAGQNMRQRF